jgi:hypothetical protein
MKIPTIHSFFKRKNIESSSLDSQLQSEDRASKLQRVEVVAEFDIDKLERDPGLRPQIWKYPFDKRDEVRRALLRMDHISPYFLCIQNQVKNILELFSHLCLTAFHHGWNILLQ